MLADGFHAGKQLVGQQLDVGAHTHQKRGHQDAIQHAEGMVGKDDRGAGGGHVRKIRVGHGVLDLELAQHGVKDVADRIVQHVLVHAVQALGGNEGPRPGNLLAEFGERKFGVVLHGPASIHGYILPTSACSRVNPR